MWRHSGGRGHLDIAIQFGRHCAYKLMALCPPSIWLVPALSVTWLNLQASMSGPSSAPEFSRVSIYYFLESSCFYLSWLGLVLANDKKHQHRVQCNSAQYGAGHRREVPRTSGYSHQSCAIQVIHVIHGPSLTVCRACSGCLPG